MKINYLLITAVVLSVWFGACVTNKEKPEEFTVDSNSPKIEIGEIEAQFDRLFSIGGLRKANIAVSYFPNEDAVCLQYKSDFITYYQFWSSRGRDAFLTALEKYNEDYAERNLDRKERRTKQKYDIVQGYLIWQLHTYAVKAKANMNVELGYVFYSRAPYFTVNQREAEFISPTSRSDNRDSQIITIFFTRAQAEELAALFARDFLDSLSVPNSNRPTQVIDRDEY